ncbi:hypothetical protein HY495_00660 [Candidatus Woesearchaeota archaeon]|nr:hypothetical protein [Candidatus Woesearchaeota archaeon]
MLRRAREDRMFLEDKMSLSLLEIIFGKSFDYEVEGSAPNREDALRNAESRLPFPLSEADKYKRFETDFDYGSSNYTITIKYSLSEKGASILSGR